MTPHRALASSLAALLATSLLGCTSTTPQPPQPAHHAAADNHPIHNIQKINDHLISGSAPETPEAFEELTKMGIKTVISVDGSSPKVDLAQSFGMRYVHIPTTYATVTDQQRLDLARAIRDLPGPIFIHCHHGMHRGPAAAAAAAIALGYMTNAEGTAFITKAGTAPNYTGLYECVAHAPLATKEQLDAASNAFPSITKAHGTTAAMVEVDLASDHLGEIKAAGWKTPEDSPDLVPAAEAGRLTDNFRIAHDDSDYIKTHGLPAQYVQKLAAAIKNASTLEEALVNNASGDALDAAYQTVKASCKDCHSTYRDKAAQRAR